jgi:hypothetical protein
VIRQTRNRIGAIASLCCVAAASAGYCAADPPQKQIGGIQPGESKVIPPSPDSIGVATMSNDRVVTLRLRSANLGMIAEGVFTYKPGDPKYEEIIAHLGGIQPGQQKTVSPFPDP